MFLLVSVRHVGAHPGGHQHGVSIQISINLGKTFLRISRIRNIPPPDPTLLYGRKYGRRPGRRAWTVCYGIELGTNDWRTGEEDFKMAAVRHFTRLFQRKSLLHRVPVVSSIR